MNTNIIIKSKSTGKWYVLNMDGVQINDGADQPICFTDEWQAAAWCIRGGGWFETETVKQID